MTALDAIMRACTERARSDAPPLTPHEAEEILAIIQPAAARSLTRRAETDAAHAGRIEDFGLLQEAPC